MDETKNYIISPNLIPSAILQENGYSSSLMLIRNVYNRNDTRLIFLPGYREIYDSKFMQASQRSINPTEFLDIVSSRYMRQSNALKESGHLQIVDGRTIDFELLTNILNSNIDNTLQNVEKAAAIVAWHLKIPLVVSNSEEKLRFKRATAGLSEYKIITSSELLEFLDSMDLD